MSDSWACSVASNELPSVKSSKDSSSTNFIFFFFFLIFLKQHGRPGRSPESLRGIMKTGVLDVYYYQESWN